MSSRRWSYAVFVLGTLLVFGALGWVTFHTLRLERREREALAHAQQQENIRLALWRMDSTITPILAREAARPYFEYRSFYPADKAYTRLLNQVRPGEVLVASPLLQQAGPFVRLHFEVDEGGTLTSPQVPTGEMRPLAESVYVSGYALSLAEQALGELRDIFLSNGPAEKQRSFASQESNVAEPTAAMDEVRTNAPLESAASPLQSAQTMRQNASEYQSRARNIEQAVRGQTAGIPLPQTAAAPPATELERNGLTGKESKELIAAREDLAGGAARKAGGAEFGAALSKDAVEPVLAGALEAGVIQREFVPRWVGTGSGRELVYTREVDAGHRHMTQGFWVDWPGLRETLLASVADILPGATLRPLAAIPAAADLATLGRSLASLPAELMTPPPVAAAGAAWSPVRTTLLVTWIAAAAAAAAIAVVLRASMDLAERRGRFVSAVTHELRTPLTTFCLYSQMLDTGMVPTEEARRSYIRTLSTESQRLAGIVQSVLEYARLGSPRLHAGAARVGLRELIERSLAPLRERCEQAGMMLVVSIKDEGAALRCDGAQVERIVLNLVDNACKYAAGAADPRVELDVAVTSQDAVITVRDHGPGVDAREQRHIFRAFFRGERHTGGSTPGLGLGLSLAFELAKDCGGDLRLVNGGEGAEFRLRLPRG